MKTTMFASHLMIAASLLVGSVALAGPSNLDEKANDPTYEAKPKTTQCDGDGCRMYVINKQGIGVEVEGKNKKQTKEKAEETADDLNEEAVEGSVEPTEVIDTCNMFPGMC